MDRRIYLNAFHMNCVVHQTPGIWGRCGDRSDRYAELASWVELAKLLERGRFDGLFLADVVGVYDVFRGSRDAAVRGAVQIPANDPSFLVPAMALVTEHLGFAFTSSVLQAHPFTFARAMSTLDHLTNGRVAWNVVASYQESTGRSYGLAGLPDHDTRYDLADEYLEVCYRLWEESWEEGAVVRDRERGIYADPARVHDVHHEGTHFRVHGCHLSEPSPQRTPVIYQAGSSPRGRRFAARHAECVFVAGPTPEVIGAYVADTRREAEAFGRRAEDLLFFLFVKVIVGGTEAEARRKLAEASANVSEEGALALLSGWSGIDFGALDPDRPIEHVETNAIRTVLTNLTHGNRRRTIREVARTVALAGGGVVLVGTPEQVADRLEEWTRVGIDGFNVSYVTTPGSFEDFVDAVVPELQRRGRMQTGYADGTLREKLFGAGRARLAKPHPAAGWRRPSVPGG